MKYFMYTMSALFGLMGAFLLLNNTTDVTLICAMVGMTFSAGIGGMIHELENIDAKSDYLARKINDEIKRQQPRHR